ncbi:MAG: glycosyltransferase [Spirulina sp. SIO3F2]|nr:glycosyltransferase [Spirulina sp. SIO3F2]
MSSLRILIMLHMPLKPELGGARVQLELAQQWQAQGHQIETFDFNQAFPEPSPQIYPLAATLMRPAFAQQARTFVRAQGHRFDVIDAHQGNLPFRKQTLGFNGLLVARSVGLHAFYALFNRHYAVEQPLKTRFLQKLLNWRDRHESQRCWRSYQTSDLLNLPNPDEKAYLDRHLQTQAKSHVFPFGLSPERSTQLAQAMANPEMRRSPPTVVFIGTWSLRKGARDWPQIITTIRRQRPETQFLLLGTGVAPAIVYRDLQTEDCPATGIEVIPQYKSEELPQLLTNATVGVFPTYVEGFGFGILEKLAAGIPTVSYAAGGPKTLLQGFNPACLVPIGQPQVLAQQILKILHLPPADYTQLCHQAQTVAQRFNWKTIAAQTLDTYQAALARLR